MGKHLSVKTQSFRFQTDDDKLVTLLKKKLGANTAQIIRQAIRVLAEKERISA